ncbi:glucosaminidase domain-containing protein [Vibrio maerlii]|uniref:glucosaminidase domain-containing protein n=1 Tax=Vibrio maerlii TaxID=2231648 RepID=UPI001F13A9C5|nr:glucosaminidase domain-containing protein [Vibrio maerlii]
MATQTQVHSTSMLSSSPSKIKTRSMLGRVIGTFSISAIAVFGFLKFESEDRKLFASEQKGQLSTAQAPTEPEPLGSKPDFSAFTDVNEKKQTFFEYLGQGVAIENHRIEGERAKLLAMQDALNTDESINSGLQSYARRLGKLYSHSVPADGVDQEWLNIMLSRVNVLPQALVLTQAANESAWGTSRFATQANNYFGQWCYQQGCGLVPLQRNEGASHEVAKFDSVQESIHRYFMNVNRNAAYRDLRTIRTALSSNDNDLLNPEAAIELAQGLLAYSERGQAYVNDIQAMIRHNNKYWDSLTQ